MSEESFVLGDLFEVEHPIIGVVHLSPLPGSPRFHGSVEQVAARACDDAQAYAEGGLNGLIVENYGDLPFFPGRVPPETVAAMAVVATEVLSRVDLPLGINVLRNDALAALALATVVGASFIRVNILMGAMVTDQGIVEGQSHRLLRRRRELGAAVRILADVMVKHARPLGRQDVAGSAQELAGRGLADALIVTGPGTGQEPAVDDLRNVKETVADRPVLVGSGLTPENAAQLLAIADGAIVGSSLKRDGRTENEVDVKRVRALLASLGR